MASVIETLRNSSESTLRPPSVAELPSTKTATPTKIPSTPVAAPKVVDVPASKPASPTPDLKSEEPSESGKPKKPLEAINMDIFQQLLDLDDDDSAEFALEMFGEYKSQSATTFDEMDAAFKVKDLEQLSSLGHFLKGSSAALGVHKVQDSCEKIQHYGHQRDEEAHVDLTDVEALALIEPLLKQVKVENAIAEQWLEKWFEDNVESED